MNWKETVDKIEKNKSLLITAGTTGIANIYYRRALGFLDDLKKLDNSKDMDNYYFSWYELELNKLREVVLFYLNNKS